MTGILHHSDRGRDPPALHSLQDLAADEIVRQLGASSGPDSSLYRRVSGDPSAVAAMKDSRSRAVQRSKIQFEHLEAVATWHEDAMHILHPEFTACGLDGYFGMRYLITDDRAMVKYTASHETTGWYLARSDIENFMFPWEANLKFRLADRVPYRFTGWILQRLGWSIQLRGAERNRDVFRCLDDIYHATDPALEVALSELLREFRSGVPP